MKKTFLALAIMGLSTLALATGSGSGSPVVTSVSGSATSGVSGATSSFSNVNGVNQAVAHGSFAKSQNTTTVGGGVLAGANGAVANTHAVSVGSTQTGAIGGSLTNPGGYGGLGGASAGATQYGFGDVKATADKTTGKVEYDLEATSNVAVGTFSTANVINSGAALSGSVAGAANATHVNVVASGNATTHAEGITIGADGAATYGVTVGSDETVTAGGALTLVGGATIASFQGGSYEAEITNEFSNTNTVNVGGGHGSHGGGSNCNNGNGNGSEGCSPGQGHGANDDEKGPGKGKK